MSLIESIDKWTNRKVLVIGEALIDNYTFGIADKLSPDAPVPNIKVEKTLSYLGGIGLVIKFIKSLGGIPTICSIVGNDYNGSLFMEKLKDLKIDDKTIYIDENLNTPQITRIKAMNQHVLRLETDYSSDISDETVKNYFSILNGLPDDFESIVILDYGIGNLFCDNFIQNLLDLLKKKFNTIPIIARPNLSNYYLYENIDLIKINLLKALNTFSIDCCTDTSLSIVGRKVLNASSCENVLLNDIESSSYLFSKNLNGFEKINTYVKDPIRTYVSVGSVIMAVLGLCFASRLPVLASVKLALSAASLSATLPPVEIYERISLKKYLEPFDS